jgi:hypothetical protein
MFEDEGEDDIDNLIEIDQTDEMLIPYLTPKFKKFEFNIAGGISRENF